MSTQRGYEPDTEPRTPTVRGNGEQWQRAADAEVDRAIALSEEGRHREAAALLEGTRRRFPGSIRAALQLTHARIHLHEYAAVVAITQDAIRIPGFDHAKDGYRIGILLNAALAACDIGEGAAATAFLHRAETIDSERSGTHYVRGILATTQGNNIDAAQHFLRALACAYRSIRNPIIAPREALHALGHVAIPRGEQTLHYVGAASQAIFADDRAAACGLLSHVLTHTPLDSDAECVASTLLRKLWGHARVP